MNLIEARKLGHEGWVRSPTRTGGEWVLFRYEGYSHAAYGEIILKRDHIDADLDAEDWEPKPAPANLFEAEVWVSPDGEAKTIRDRHEKIASAQNGWRRILVREVTE